MLLCFTEILSPNIKANREDAICPSDQAFRLVGGETRRIRDEVIAGVNIKITRPLCCSAFFATMYSWPPTVLSLAQSPLRSGIYVALVLGSSDLQMPIPLFVLHIRCTVFAKRALLHGASICFCQLSVTRRAQHLTRRI
jgi:hypothetical protein